MISHDGKDPGLKQTNLRKITLNNNTNRTKSNRERFFLEIQNRLVAWNPSLKAVIICQIL